MQMYYCNKGTDAHRKRTSLASCLVSFVSKITEESWTLFTVSSSSSGTGSSNSSSGSRMLNTVDFFLLVDQIFGIKAHGTKK